MSMILAMHVMTHLLTGSFIVSMVLMRKAISFKEKVVLLGLASLLGIVPDLLGNRYVSPWSHSIVVMGLVMVPIVFIFKLLLKKYSYIQLYLCLAGSVLGHILVDYLGHGVHLVYPLSSEAYTLPLIYLGDPTVWVPMLVVVMSFVLPMPLGRRRVLSVTGAVCIVLYLGFKLAMLMQLEQGLPRKFTLTPQAAVQVAPLGDNRVHKLSDFWKMGFDVIDSQRRILGVLPIPGGGIRLDLNLIYAMKGDVVRNNSGKDGLENVYRLPAAEDEATFEVREESRQGPAAEVVARDREGNPRLFIYKDGAWAEGQRE
ncbi:metal-dependent hydrolase [Paenibacillus piscarius]|uniref:metal-dependent hydrolase n=1 Tax=Paenibacillus piscarius TaxID=1089681 RepID=UPI001EE96039|nr:metal-dependent hydrolase [Paenibacillus piscarius]